ncbi:creatinine amidohydrolase [Rhodococcus triatomae]|uniref:Creatinine amidohydrolase n=1 Tax=Rhodococcus triatomae TaxID=300028 RepID=A0A1G8JK00_9NOCA|nr:creatinine amidohydrolase [Rhodococcus triatomae]
MIVPVGSLEQHGPHLPLDTDTVVATAVARELPGMLAPPVAYGASGEHEAFPGTVSWGTEALTVVLVEYGRSVCRWARRVLWVNGHGGNGPALVAATTLLRHEGRDVAWFPCAIPGADAHAGRTETSLLLHLSPERVRLARAEPGNCTPMTELLPVLRERGVAPVAPNGVLGDPTGASADEGRRLLAAVVGRAAAAVEAWDPGPDGRLRY